MLAAVLDDAAAALTCHFRRSPGEIVIMPREGNPIAYFQTTPAVIGLSATECYWAKYIYQFSHELCHLLTNHNRLQASPSQHFQVDEIVCEVASLFVLSVLAEKWKRVAPANLQWFAPHLRSYVDDLLMRYQSRPPGRIYEDVIHKAVEREKNAFMAARLLPVLLQNPSYWVATQSFPDPTPSLQEYLGQWRNLCHHSEAVEVLTSILASEE